MSEEEEQEEEQEAAVKMSVLVVVHNVWPQPAAAKHADTRQYLPISADIFTKASSKPDKAQTSWKAGEP